MEKLGEKDVEIIEAMCDNDLNLSKVARALFQHRNTIVYHLDKIKKNTGLDPRKFYELVKLKEMADNYSVFFIEEKKRLCKMCGNQIIDKKRRKFCSDKCRKTHAARGRKKVQKGRKEMCMKCTYSYQVTSSEQWICKNSGKIVISSSGRANKNSSDCFKNIEIKMNAS